MKSSYLIAIGIVVALVLWMVSGAVSKVEEPEVEIVTEPVAVTLMKVRVREFFAQPVTRQVVVQGQLEPWRSVVVRAETSGLVTELLENSGSRVSQGDLLVRLDAGDRQARLTMARAKVEKNNASLEASQKLAKKNMQSIEAIRAIKSDLASAEAELAAVTLDIERTEIRAPFSGAIEDHSVEQGTLLERGDVVLTLVDDNRLKATAQVPQNSRHYLKPGQAVSVQLMSGENLQGRLSFISRQGSASTRSFRVEVEVPNAELSFAAGMSAVIIFPVEEVSGHFISPSLLVLDDGGQVGIIAIDDSDTAVFFPVRLVRAETGGAWVTGLPERVRLVTFGQGFVRAGEQVIAVPESEG